MRGSLASWAGGLDGGASVLEGVDRERGFDSARVFDEAEACSTGRCVGRASRGVRRLKRCGWLKLRTTDRWVGTQTTALLSDGSGVAVGGRD